MSLKKESTIIGPLNLIKIEEESKLCSSVAVNCIICENVFEFPAEKDKLLGHLFTEHRIVIADVDDIALLDEYLKYWNARFRGKEIAEYCTTMLLDKLPDGTISSKKEEYFLLSDVLPEDYEIRHSLHSKRLESVLSQHQIERTDRSFERGCVFCRDVITPSCYDFVEHLFSKHFLHLGKPTNLVYINELIDLVESKMERLICIFCEKIFKDRTTLKEHMRKKGHKRINPDNKAYDKFFLINYKTFKSSRTPAPKPSPFKPQNNTAWKSNRAPRNYVRDQRPATVDRTNSNDDDGDDSDWSDWEGDEQPVICLFCSRTDTSFPTIKSHMTDAHKFDFDRRVADLNFYQRIKIVNYLRRQMHVLKCPSCDEQFAVSRQLQEHLDATSHCDFGDAKKWDQPEYFFPTYEDDALLCCLEDEIEEDETTEGVDVVVIGEEQNVSANKDAEELSREIATM